MSQPAAPCQRHDLSIDQQHALFTAARNLTDEFSGAFGTETIDRFLHSSYDQFADRASVANYLPLLAERFARQRLKALARIEGKDTGGGCGRGVGVSAADLEVGQYE